MVSHSLYMHPREHHDSVLLSSSESSSTFPTRMVESTDNVIKRRHRLTSTESVYLNQQFALNPCPNTATRQRMANALGMSEKAVQTWFQKGVQRRDGVRG